MTTWLFSDPHWGLTEERMDIMGRPHDYAQRLFAFWLKNVQPDDLVICLGDVCDQGNAEHLAQLYLPGRKVLLRGNHDRAITDEQFAPFFEKVFPENTLLTMELAGVPVSLSHYPHYGTAEFFHITGHTHSAWKYQRNMLNVGVDVLHFCLMNAEKIPFYLKAITEYYDQDCWVADHPANQAHRDRGKAGYYFDEPAVAVEADLTPPLKLDDDIANRFCRLPYDGPEIELEWDEEDE